MRERETDERQIIIWVDNISYINWNRSRRKTEREKETKRK